MPPIAGHSLLVIGGTSGIGLAVAKLAAAEGLEVSIASSNPQRVETAVRAIRAAVPGAAPARVRGFVCDVNHDDAESSLEQLLSDVVVSADGRPLDHVVYTAARVADPADPDVVRPVADVNAAYLRQSMQFGYVVPLLLAKLSPRYLNQSCRSSLTFTSGRLAERPLKGMSAVSGWAASLYGTTRGLALDLAPVRVNLVSPGLTDTQTGEDWARWVKEMAKTSLLGKVGTPEEVAEAYIYLMKDTNSTGSCVSTNGGVLVQ
ncbi:putative short chain dehydrogenase/ reductase [Daldinia caldariorum]|uniref:putative short chain dehydrogenase/ reductase n=1 Tax=Daldinia caldariorum TaxID=326644 RepID=UPI002007F956|nr:putative short chain dehydrogenase/ reductase [Daldinia caldariorum]KAI1472653.1 putative short chain dehydrogenase/ reductase [Daldinia caldariorum]